MFYVTRYILRCWPDGCFATGNGRICVRQWTQRSGSVRGQLSITLHKPVRLACSVSFLHAHRNDPSSALSSPSLTRRVSLELFDGRQHAASHSNARSGWMPHTRISSVHVAADVTSCVSLGKSGRSTSWYHIIFQTKLTEMLSWRISRLASTHSLQSFPVSSAHMYTH